MAVTSLWRRKLKTKPASSPDNDAYFANASLGTMSDYYLPASPSWYCSRASDCYKDTFIFGAKRSIFLVKIISNPPQILGSISAHQDRVVGVSLRKDPFDPDRLECCSAGEDGKVRVWDLASRTLQNEHSDHQVSIVASSSVYTRRDIVARCHGANKEINRAVYTTLAS